MLSLAENLGDLFANCCIGVFCQRVRERRERTTVCRYQQFACIASSWTEKFELFNEGAVFCQYGSRRLTVRMPDAAPNEAKNVEQPKTIVTHRSPQVNPKASAA